MVKCKTCGTHFVAASLTVKCTYCGSPEYVNLPTLQSPASNYLLRDEQAGFGDTDSVQPLRCGIQSLERVRRNYQPAHDADGPGGEAVALDAPADATA